MAEPKKVTREREQVAKLYSALVASPLVKFPAKSLVAPMQQGVYVIYGPNGRVLHVGSTPSGLQGIWQRLRNHLYKASSFTLVHLKVAASAIGTNLIDDALARRGLKRDIAMHVPSWLDVHPIVSTTDLVAALPRRWTRTRPFATTCVAKPLPVDEVELAIDAVWHPRHDEDPGHAWIRAAITKAMQQPDEFSRRV